MAKEKMIKEYGAKKFISFPPLPSKKPDKGSKKATSKKTKGKTGE